MSRNPSRVPRGVAGILLLLLFSLGVVACSWLRPSPPPPRLVVVLVIDQFRADYLERFRDDFGEDGFLRLLRGGASFTNCYYPYGVTETAAGHATLATGTVPARHGIPGNDLWEEAYGQIVASAYDREVSTLGSEPLSAPASPRRLMVATLGDQVRLQGGPQARVLGVAIKDRSAVFTTGREAQAAYWFNGLTGEFVSSTYFQPELPEWVAEFNRVAGAKLYYGKSWRVGDRVVSDLTSTSGRPDPEFVARLIRSPFGNDLILDFVQILLREEKMGADDVTDYLFVGFSSNDLAGHDWGPYSDAMADMVRQTDRHVARLLALLDEAVGAGNWVLAFSGDHGVAPTIEQARERNLPAKALDTAAYRKAVEDALVARWGPGPWVMPAGYASRFIFRRETLEKYGVPVAEAARVAGAALTSIDGILGYYSPGSNNLDPDIAERMRLSYYPGRSPDVAMVPEPYAIRDPLFDPGQHGSPHDYDRHVPLVFFGAGVAAGEYDEPVSPIDLAPTLATVAGVAPPPGATGRVLRQVMGGAASE